MKTRTSRTLALVSLIGVVSWAAPSALRAANININDINPNDTVTISASQFEGGFSVNGNLIQAGLLSSGSATVPESPDPITFSGTWQTNEVSSTAARTIYLVESQGSAPLISDILQYSITENGLGLFSTITGTFRSDFENNLGVLPTGIDPGDVFVEDGSVVPFFAPFLTGQVLSDVDAAPLPASVWGGILLMGGLLVSRLKRKAQLAA